MEYCSTEDINRCQSLNHNACGQVPGAPYTNVGCYEAGNAISRQVFQCANRMDLASSMFKIPINDAMITNQTTKSINMNTQLNFNETHLTCSDDLVIEWTDLFQPWTPDQKCSMQNGKEIPLADMTSGLNSLVLDYSFKQKNAIERVWNRTLLSSLMCQFDLTSKCSENACANTMQFCDGIGDFVKFIENRIFAYTVYFSYS